MSTDTPTPAGAPDPALRTADADASTAPLPETAPAAETAPLPEGGGAPHAEATDNTLTPAPARKRAAMSRELVEWLGHGWQAAPRMPHPAEGSGVASHAARRRAILSEHFAGQLIVVPAGQHKVRANDIRPGLTGLAQVNGRDELPIDVKARYDGEYAAHVTFWNDVKIFFRSITYVFQRRGVVEGGTGAMNQTKEEKSSK